MTYLVLLPPQFFHVSPNYIHMGMMYGRSVMISESRPIKV